MSDRREFKPVLAPLFAEFRRTWFIWRIILLIIAILWILLIIDEAIRGTILLPNNNTATPWKELIYEKPINLVFVAGRCLYIIAQSITTIGFGDIVPSTPEGKLIAILGGILGLATFGVFVAVILRGLQRYI